MTDSEISIELEVVEDIGSIAHELRQIGDAFHEAADAVDSDHHEYQSLPEQLGMVNIDMDGDET